MKNWIPCKWRLSGVTDPLEETCIEQVAERTGAAFVIRRQGRVLTKEGRWEFEPMAPWRDDKFRARSRFDTIDEAKSAYDAYCASQYKMNTATAGRRP